MGASTSLDGLGTGLSPGVCMIFKLSKKFKTPLDNMEKLDIIIYEQ